MNNITFIKRTGRDTENITETTVTGLSYIPQPEDMVVLMDDNKEKVYQVIKVIVDLDLNHYTVLVLDTGKTKKEYLERESFLKK